MSLIYVRTVLEVPEAGTFVHTAELEEINGSTARMLRLIQQGHADRVTGTWNRGHAVGEIAVPGNVVPHPDTYADFPDIKAERLSAEQFARAWENAEKALDGN